MNKPVENVARMYYVRAYKLNWTACEMRMYHDMACMTVYISLCI